MNLNIRTLRLETGHAWGRDRVHWPSEFSALFSRPSWMWTDVCQIAGSSWMQFVGRTIQTDTIGYSQLGFYDSRSARAQAILAKVEPAASTAHPTLLFDL
jgi:hypothetical protein